MTSCSVSGCTRTPIHICRTLCDWHFHHNDGQVSRKEPRPSIVEDGIVKIPLDVNAVKGYAIVDLVFQHLDKYNWHKDTSGYASTQIKKKIIRMHHMIIGKPPIGFVTDHKNRNKLDNRQDNLRFVTPSENNFNHPVHVFKNHKTHCIRGHEFKGANVYIRPDNGLRQCKACGPIRQKQRYHNA